MRRQVSFILFLSNSIVQITSYNLQSFEGMDRNVCCEIVFRYTAMPEENHLPTGDWGVLGRLKLQCNLLEWERNSRKMVEKFDALGYSGMHFSFMTSDCCSLYVYIFVLCAIFSINFLVF